MENNIIYKFVGYENPILFKRRLIKYNKSKAKGSL